VPLHIDVREACAPRPTGKGAWTLGLVRELLTRDIELTLWTDTPLPADLADAARARHVVTHVLPPAGLAWHLRTAATLAWRHAGEIYLSPTSYLVPWLLGTRLRCITVVHDLIAFRGEPHDRRAQGIERLTLPRCVRRAHHLITTSASARADLLRRYPWLAPPRVTAIQAGPRRETVSPARGGSQTIVCLGTLCPRKNQRRLIEAFGRLPTHVRGAWQLILVGGRGWDDAPIVEAAAHTPGVRWLGYASETELEALLEAADLLAYPSLYEGFGLPVLEAFQRGIPVLTSNRGSLRELAGGSAFIVDPDDTAAISRGLQTLITDANLRADFRQRGLQTAATYTWAHTVDRLLTAIGHP
jgi:glycosyltransferase involved in cell wall biosynthesis